MPTDPAPVPALPPPPLRLQGSPATMKILLIVMLTVGLLIPLYLVYDVIQERHARYDSVVSGIGQDGGAPQRATGPILVVPYRVQAQDAAAEGGTRLVQRWAYILPDSYSVRATVAPETRRRGLFEAVVYTVDLEIDGDFVMPDPEALTGAGAAINWTEAFVYIGVADPRSIREDVSLYWNGQQDIPFTPGAPGQLGALVGAGMTARISGLAEVATGTRLPFATKLALNGSGSLSFVPLGRENRMAATSSWPDPSFQGTFLPVRSEVGPDGFTAEWLLSYFGRGYPQVWTGGDDYDAYLAALPASGFGVSFYLPVDGYQQTERSAKYGILFIVFTFITLFLFEAVWRTRIHIMQYGLVGLSLCLFYLLLLSFAEQMGFASAYALGAAAVVLQITLFCRPVLGTIGRALVLGVLLAILYGALYVLLQLEDLALLIGSIGLFVALSALMYATRRVDWYAVQAPEPPGSGPFDGGGRPVRGGPSGPRQPPVLLDRRSAEVVEDEDDDTTLPHSPPNPAASG
jgi:inner membrane protein